MLTTKIWKYESQDAEGAKGATLLSQSRPFAVALLQNATAEVDSITQEGPWWNVWWTAWVAYAENPIFFPQSYSAGVQELVKVKIIWQFVGLK